MIAGVYLLILGPMLAAGVLAIFAYGVRRLEPLVALLAAGTTALLGALAMTLPLDTSVVLGGRQVAMGEPVILLGRQLILKDSTRMGLAFLFVVTALLFVQGWRTRAGRSFYPIGLVVLGILCAALVIRPFLYAALLLNIAAALLTIVLQSEDSTDTMGTLRFLFMTTLAMLVFLFAGWQVEQYALNPDDLSIARSVMLALALGFGLLLSVVPFHMWMPAAARNAPPVAAVFVFTVFNAVIWILLFDVLQEYAWLPGQPGFFTGVQTVGMLTAVVGGLLAFASYDFGRVMAYGLLADWGCALVVLGLGQQAGMGAVILGILTRPISLMLLAVGMASARQRARTIEFSDLVGLAWNSPWTTAALIIGGFSLSGIPPFPGFLTRWAQIRLLANSYELGSALTLLAVTVGVSAGALRGLDFCAMRPRDLRPDDPRHSPEPRWLVLLVLGGLLTSLAFMLFPAMFDATLRAVAASYTFLGQ